MLNIYASIPLFSIGLFFVCVFCHGELAGTKPGPAYLTQFYLSLSAGGALGGLFVALVAPRIFSNYWEAPVSLVGVCILAIVAARPTGARRWLIGLGAAAVATGAIVLAGGGATVDSARKVLPGSDSDALTIGLVVAAALVFVVAAWRNRPVAILVTALACTGFYTVKYYRFLSLDTVYATRNFYGTLRVKDAGTLRSLMHGVILHGDQYRTPDKMRMPTTYYGPGSGIALALKELRPDGRPIDVAMIGMGTGTLTAWGRPGDRYQVYELNPQVPQVAGRFFTYLADSQAKVSVAMGDARLSMERELADGSAVAYDIIAVDAFSSDSIPGPPHHARGARGVHAPPQA